MKIYASLCLIVITMLSLAGCGGGGDDGGTTPDNRVTSLVIAPNQQLNVGAQRRLQFTARTAAGTDVTSQLTGFTFWTSSNTAILSFNGDVARGVSNGTATVRVSYTNPGGQVVTSAPVQVTVGTAIVNPVARAFAAIPATGPYSVTFTPTGGVATTLTNSVALGSFSTFTQLAAGTGRVRVFENGTQRSSREVTIGADDRLSFVVAGTPANTVIAVVPEETTEVANGEFRLRFVLGYIASGRQFDVYILRPGQTVNDVEPVKLNRGAETGFVMDLPFGADRFAVTTPGTKTVVFQGNFESPNRSDVTLVFDETTANNYRFNFWGTTPP